MNKYIDKTSLSFIIHNQKEENRQVKNNCKCGCPIFIANPLIGYKCRQCGENHPTNNRIHLR